MTCHQYEPAGTAQVTLTRHLPTGDAWRAYRVPGKRAYRLLAAVAAAFEDASRALCRLAAELDPRSTDDMVTDWERALSLPDPCYPPARTLDERRQRIIFRLTKRRWTTAQDWHDLAAMFGLTIRITPGWLVQRPALYAAEYPKRYDLFPKLGRFRVYIDILEGCGAAGYAYDYPAEYPTSTEACELLRCIIERIAPANVVIVWNNNPLAIDVFADEFAEDFE